MKHPMKPPALLGVLALIVMAGVHFEAQAKPQPSPPILAAKKAFESRDVPGLRRAADRLANDPLAVWPDYWLLRLGLPQKATDKNWLAAMQAFVQRNGHHVLALAIQKDWALATLEHAPWEQAAVVVQGLPLQVQHPAIACARGRLVVDKTAVLQSLVVGQEDSRTCIRLAQSLIEGGIIKPSDVVQRARWAALAGEKGHADQLWQSAAKMGYKPPAHEPALLGLLAATRVHPSHALEQFNKLAGQFSAEQRDFARLSIGAWLWVRSEEKAWSMTKAGLPSVGQQPAQIQELVARQALRQSDWPAVLAATADMPDAVRQKDIWLFWRARALEVLGHPDTAKNLLRQIGPGLGFYSLLAAEALEQDWFTAYTEVPKREQVVAHRNRLRQHPSVSRTIGLAKAGLRAEAVMEWNHLINGLKDEELIALSEIAYGAKLPDRAIAAAIQTKQLHALDFRYPSLFLEDVLQSSRSKTLPPPWVMGLIRQESRFITDIKSPVGATGLMQIMPKTASMLAKETGQRRFKQGQLAEPAANIQLGTHYMAQLQTQFDGSIVLATAAYNAGPSRSKLWRASLSRSIDGAAFAESIPFTETRDYVKAVTANMAVYQRLLQPSLIKVSLQTPPQRLTDLLGTITP